MDRMGWRPMVNGVWLSVGEDEGNMAEGAGSELKVVSRGRPREQLVCLQDGGLGPHGDSDPGSAL
jgi:hypothetical protein